MGKTRKVWYEEKRDRKEKEKKGKDFQELVFIALPQCQDSLLAVNMPLLLSPYFHLSNTFLFRSFPHSFLLSTFIIFFLLSFLVIKV